jgi:hypothetical protein
MSWTRLDLWFNYFVRIELIIDENLKILEEINVNRTETTSFNKILQDVYCQIENDLKNKLK